jgi:hypothetical protein
MTSLTEDRSKSPPAGRGPRRLRLLVLAATVPLTAAAAQENQAPAAIGLQEARLQLDKYIETQQIIARERKDWQQGKEVLVGRLDLVKKELGVLDAGIKQTEEKVAETARKRADLAAENDHLKASIDVLARKVATLEAGVRQLWRTVPEPVRPRALPLMQRIPEDPAATTVSLAERFQNVLGVLNELNKANNEITVNYEVHELGGGRRAEVKVLYVGLAQAYYVSSSGEAGIGRPTTDGWKWTPEPAIANRVLIALEIVQGKQKPAFVPLPVRLR